MTTRRCRGTTRKGTPCTATARHGSLFCLFHDPSEEAEARRRENEWREIGLGAQILRDLGISSIKLIASRERHYVGLEGFGIRILSTEIW